jgi:hypothetical protein
VDGVQIESSRKGEEIVFPVVPAAVLCGGAPENHSTRTKLMIYDLNCRMSFIRTAAYLSPYVRFLLILIGLQMVYFMTQCTDSAKALYVHVTMHCDKFPYNKTNQMH